MTAGVFRNLQQGDSVAIRPRIDDLAHLGRARSGGYRRFAWTREDADLREPGGHIAGEQERNKSNQQKET